MQAAISQDQILRAKSTLMGQQPATSRERILAVQLLGLYGSESSIDLLTECVESISASRKVQGAGFKLAEEAALALAQTEKNKGRQYLHSTAKSETANREVRVIAIKSLEGVVTQPILESLAASLQSKDYLVVRSTLESLAPLLDEPYVARKYDLSELLNSLYALGFYSGVPRDVATKSYKWFVKYASNEAIDGMAAIVEKAHPSEDKDYLKKIITALFDINSDRSLRRLSELLVKDLIEPSWYEHIATGLKDMTCQNTTRIGKELANPPLIRRLKAAVSKNEYSKLKAQIGAGRILLTRVQRGKLSPLPTIPPTPSLSRALILVPDKS